MRYQSNSTSDVHSLSASWMWPDNNVDYSDPRHVINNLIAEHMDGNSSYSQPRVFYRLWDSGIMLITSNRNIYEPEIDQFCHRMVVPMMDYGAYQMVYDTSYENEATAG